MTNDGLEVKWYPLTDASGCPVVPTGVNYAPHADGFWKLWRCHRH